MTDSKGASWTSGHPQDPWTLGPTSTPHHGILGVHVQRPGPAGALLGPCPTTLRLRKYLPSPPQAALGVTVTSRQESDSEL